LLQRVQSEQRWQVQQSRQAEQCQIQLAVLLRPLPLLVWVPKLVVSQEDYQMGREQKNREDSQLLQLQFEREHESVQERNQGAMEPNTHQDPVNHLLSGHLLLLVVVVIQEGQLQLSWETV
jgi:hypothetical protein